MLGDLTLSHPKGYGFVRFGNKEERDRSYAEMQGYGIANRPIRINPAKSNRSHNQADRDGDPLLLSPRFHQASLLQRMALTVIHGIFKWDWVKKDCIWAIIAEGLCIILCAYCQGRLGKPMKHLICMPCQIAPHVLYIKASVLPKGLRQI